MALAVKKGGGTGGCGAGGRAGAAASRGSGVRHCRLRAQCQQGFKLGAQVCVFLAQPVQFRLMPGGRAICSGQGRQQS